ncbi:hypothetical protein Leryth_019719 [Lithospermum erythrorhizon]|nr:hypothetical protein Leryth_019719 [Lithospermum erythrorhizon]
MGVKRPFDEETVQELPFKQVKQHDRNSEMNSIPKDNFPYEASEKDALSGDVENMEYEPDKDLETSAPSSWATSTSSDEESGKDGSFYLPLYADFDDLNFPMRAPTWKEDACSSLRNDSPRKVVPIGQNHQADVPEWNFNAFRKASFCSINTTDDDRELKVVGTSIISMPDPNASFSYDGKVGSGRTNCNCLDKYSIRCARQHVKEARIKLRESLGEEKFSNLGFYDMGEEVALKWTEEEEQFFHEIIYNNPVSLGKNFWKRLSVVFPSRTSMELMSYYFNVFILRRRAVQNRSDFLDIDSDDDEWQGDGRHPNDKGHHNYSVDSDGDEDLQVDPGSGISYDIIDDDDDGDDNYDNGNGDVGIDRQYIPENGNQEEQVHTRPTEKFEKHSGVNCQVNSNAKGMSSNNYGHDSQTSIFSTIQESGFKGEHTRFYGGKISGTNEVFGSGFTLEGCDTKGWGDAFSTSHTKNIDLLPTCNMIEEIFGPFPSQSD